MRSNASDLDFEGRNWLTTEHGSRFTRYHHPYQSAQAEVDLQFGSRLLIFCCIGLLSSIRTHGVAHECAVGKR